MVGRLDEARAHDIERRIGTGREPTTVSMKLLRSSRRIVPGTICLIVSAMCAVTLAQPQTGVKTRDEWHRISEEYHRETEACGEDLDCQGRVLLKFMDGRLAPFFPPNVTDQNCTAKIRLKFVDKGPVVRRLNVYALNDHIDKCVLEYEAESPCTLRYHGDFADAWLWTSRTVQRSFKILKASGYYYYSEYRGFSPTEPPEKYQLGTLKKVNCLWETPDCANRGGYFRLEIKGHPTNLYDGHLDFEPWVWVNFRAPKPYATGHDFCSPEGINGSNVREEANPDLTADYSTFRVTAEDLKKATQSGYFERKLYYRYEYEDQAVQEHTVDIVITFPEVCAVALRGTGRNVIGNMVLSHASDIAGAIFYDQTDKAKEIIQTEISNAVGEDFDTESQQAAARAAANLANPIEPDLILESRGPGVAEGKHSVTIQSKDGHSESLYLEIDEASTWDEIDAFLGQVVAVLERYVEGC